MIGGPEAPPEDIECIIQPKGQRGGLYIGNLSAALSVPTLKRLNIRAVVSMAKGGFLTHSEQDLPNYLYIQAYDKRDFDLTPYFDPTFDFIERHRKRSNVLVHCMAGISRSVTIVIAYLMRKTGRTMVDCYCEVKKYRSKVSPNEGFLQQLKRYQDTLKNQEKKSPEFDRSGTNSTPEPRLRHHRRGKTDQLANLTMSVDLHAASNKIQPIDIEARINNLRSRYSSVLDNPQDDISTTCGLPSPGRKPSCLLPTKTRDTKWLSKSKTYFHSSRKHKPVEQQLTLN